MLWFCTNSRTYHLFNTKNKESFPGLFPPLHVLTDHSTSSASFSRCLFSTSFPHLLQCFLPPSLVFLHPASKSSYHNPPFPMVSTDVSHFYQLRSPIQNSLFLPGNLFSGRRSARKFLGKIFYLMAYPCVRSDDVQCGHTASLSLTPPEISFSS